MALNASAAQAFWHQMGAIIGNGVQNTQRGGVQLMFDYGVDALAVNGDRWELRVGGSPDTVVVDAKVWQSNGKRLDGSLILNANAGTKLYSIFVTHLGAESKDSPAAKEGAK